ncbi:MAG: exodeoxyribonuclease VII large subunit [Clostridia bacterium]|nr:exodeoxyribonuclease VII large subunit [Clostridia bacterium]
MEHIYTVAELTGFIKSYLESSPQLKRVSVKGEISNCSAPSGKGHVFFTVKDESATLRGVMFKSHAEKLSFKPENGMRVLCTGRISVYPQGGQYLLYADSLTPEGEGALYIALEQLKKKLAAEGLFELARKKKLPKIPMRVGVITSATGAAVRDIINVAARRFPAAELTVYPSLVQGVGAAEQLAAGVVYFNKTKKVDVIIIGRGGGSIEELWEFNSELLARTVAASSVPVVSAVGHETDFTVCDFAADFRAPTPSAAAEIVFPDKADIIRRFENAENRMRTLLSARIATEKRYLLSLKNSKALSSPTAGFDDLRLRIADNEQRLHASVKRRMEQSARDIALVKPRLDTAAARAIGLQKLRLDGLKDRLFILNPLSVLDRGYAAVTDKDGKTLTGVSALTVGEGFVLKMADGEAEATVGKVELYGNEL